MDKFNLKWNDFWASVSQTFSSLRKEKELCDVTLVSDDEVQVPAHKLILSASSSFFKSIFKNNTHPHTLIYLSGVDSTNLEFLLDYIYQGEVQIFQEQLDAFIDVAEKFKVSGLISTENEKSNMKNNFQDLDYTKILMKEDDSDNENLNVERRMKAYNAENCKVVYTVDSETELDIKSKVKELIVKNDGQYTCKACGKLVKDSRNMRKHAETHIDGISYECNICDKRFRTKDSFKSHNYKNHRH